MKRVLIGELVLSLCLSVMHGVSSESAFARTIEQPQVETQRIEIRQLHQTIMDDLRTRFESKNMQLELQVLFPKKPIEVPAGRLGLDVRNDRFSDLTGRRAFRVQVRVDAQLIKTVSVVASVTARVEVLTPVRWIKVYEVLTSKDVVKRTVNLRTLSQDVLMDPKDIIGKQAARSLPPHQPLRSSFLAEPPLVHKGDRVMIEVRRGGLFVQTLGVAKASGQSGELITVTNQTSGRDVLAMVRSAGVVEVKF
ncbi:MAG: hypothetical protein NPIRA05_10300 [Nitrospirales bacterium]|nr:MAG: hypothetical protein NPIRA05_10300 [Nitrospirales bacterium]